MSIVSHDLGVNMEMEDLKSFMRATKIIINSSLKSHFLLSHKKFYFLFSLKIFFSGCTIFFYYFLRFLFYFFSFLKY